MSWPTAALLCLIAAARSPTLALEQVLDAPHLPLSFARSLVLPLEVVDGTQQLPGDAMAYYRPAAAAAAGEGALAGAAATEAVGAARVLRLSYLDERGGLRPWSQLAVDEAEYLAHALILAALHLEVLAEPPRQPAHPARALLLERARRVFARDPPTTQLASYVTTVASFGSHLVSLRNEIERSRLRGLAGGRAAALCRAARAERGLFAAWRQAFDGAQYTQGAPDRPVLAAEDLRGFAEHVLGVPWRGDPAADLGALVCGR